MMLSHKEFDMKQSAINTLANIHNTLLGVHPTGEDILAVGFCISSIRSLIKELQESKEGDGDEHSV